MLSVTFTLVSLALAAVSALLMVWNWRSWKVACDAGLDEDELNFAWRQFRRRVQASAMIGLVAVAIFIGQFVESLLVRAFFWAGVVLLLFWILLLALADVLATQQHFGRIRRRDLADQVKLQVQIRRRRDHKGNGRTPPTDAGSP